MPESVQQTLAGVAPRPGVAKPDPILVVDDIRRSFGGLKAVDVDHLEVQRGSITALIGPNGAGKTTFFNLITGFDRPDTGRSAFDNADITGWPSHSVARAGMVRTFQLTKALTRLTCLENMKLGARDQRGEHFLSSIFPSLWREQETDIEGRADALLERFRMHHMRDEAAGTLSGGQRKLLEMARSLMTEPSMIMLDEPMAGVNPALTQSLLEHIKELPRSGMTVLFVEHDMDVVMDISNWVVVMAQGSIIAEGPPDQVARNPAVIDAYLGKDHGDESRFTPIPRVGKGLAPVDAATPVLPPTEGEGRQHLSDLDRAPSDQTSTEQANDGQSGDNHKER